MLLEYALLLYRRFAANLSLRIIWIISGFIIVIGAIWSGNVLTFAHIFDVLQFSAMSIANLVSIACILDVLIESVSVMTDSVQAQLHNHTKCF